MSIVRMTHDGFGMLETNRIDRSYNESQCALDKVAFPNGAEVGTIVTVDKANGTLKVGAGLKGILGNSERIYDQFHAGLKNYKVGAGEMGSVYFLRDGDTFTTNTVCYDDSEYASEQTNLIPALKAANTTPVYGKVDATTGVIQLTATGTDAAFTVVKLTTMPDGQAAVKFIVTDVTKL